MSPLEGSWHALLYHDEIPEVELYEQGGCQAADKVEVKIWKTIKNGFGPGLTDCGFP